MKKSTKKTGGDPPKGGKKASDNSTSYGTKPIYHSSPAKGPAPLKTSSVSSAWLKQERAKQNASSLAKKKK